MSAPPPTTGNDPTGQDYSTMRMCSDGRRSLIASGTGVLVAFAASFLIDDVYASGARATGTRVSLLLLGWNVFAVVYVVLTARTFDKYDSERFALQMAARTELRSAFWKRLNPFGDGPVYAIEASIVAFVVVLVVPHVRGIAINEWVLVPISLTILLSCWALSIISYSLHYAEHDMARPGLDYPGTRTNAYTDYLYFSIAVATTFGATDVSITTPHMRRVVNLHTVLTFVYNSVIVALLAALLIR